MKLVIPFKLILIILGILAVAAIILKFISSQNSIPFLTGDDSLIKTADWNIRADFDKGNDPYKDLEVEVVKNDGTRAQVRTSFTKQGKCEVLEVDPAKQYQEGESYAAYKEEGFLDFTKEDLYLLEAMGIIKNETWGPKILDDKQWKRCYDVSEYVNISSRWKRNGLTTDTNFMPAKEQEKLGFKLTEQMIEEAQLKLTPTTNPMPTATKSTTTVELKVADDDPILGSRDAKVTVISFQDFQCPFCGAFNGFETSASKMLKEKDSAWQATLPNLKKEYIEKGKVAYVWKDNPILGDESRWAAEAARCAQDQGKFWEYHDYLFAHQKGKNQGAFSKENLKKVATELKLNSSEFGKCLDSNKYEKKIEAALAIATEAKAIGTPTTFVNGQPLPGAYSYTALKELIEKELK